MTEDITDVHELCTGIAGAIDELDPDVLSIEEGPANSARMNEFIDKYLGGRFQCFGYIALQHAIQRDGISRLCAHRLS